MKEEISREDKNWFVTMLSYAKGSGDDQSGKKSTLS